jgi:AcrR family transcriptional regulator
MPTSREPESTRGTGSAGGTVPTSAIARPRVRMTGVERREQLIDIGRSVFAERGFEAATIEEIAARAEVSKPVVYEHFGGKDGLYAVVVDREVRTLLAMLTSALTSGRARELLEQAALALLDYIENHTDGFHILVRDSPAGTSTGSFATIISDIASRVEHILVAQFTTRGYDPRYAGMYAQMLVGMVATTGQWWLDERNPSRDEVAAHLVNLAWNGLSGLERHPALTSTEEGEQR